MRRYATRLFIDPTATGQCIRFTAQPTDRCYQPELVIVTVEPITDRTRQSHDTPRLFRLQGIRVESDRNNFAHFHGWYNAQHGYGIGLFLPPHASRLVPHHTIH